MSNLSNSIAEVFAGHPMPRVRDLVVMSLLPLVTVPIVYYEMFQSLIVIWEENPNYSHGYVVPPACLLFACLAWHKVGWFIRPDVSQRNITLGIVEMVFGFVLHMVAWFLGNLLLDVFSLVCVLRGMMLALGGSKVNEAYGFSILFLLFMAPLPQSWYNPVALVLQEVVAVISTRGLGIIGVPAFREGYIISMPNYQMEVAAACSGLRQLTAVLALSFAIGHLSNRGNLFMAALVALSMPIAVLSNCLRVLITGLILLFAGPEMADGIFHTLEGMVIVGMSAGLIVLCAWGLSQLEIFAEKESPSSSPESATRTANTIDGA